MRYSVVLCLFGACVAGIVVAGAMPGAISNAQAADAAASAQALESLRGALAEPGALESVAQGAWADVPLTNPDAIAARDLLWEAHRAAKRAECQAEIEARELGDGVYQLAPRMADHWAAAAMMAGHPNGVSLEPVRNVPFALQVGALDAAYDRAKIGADYGRALEAFRAADPNGYQTFVKIHEGKGHWMERDDAAALPWMAKQTRNPVPDRVVWQPTGTSRASFSWLALPADAPRSGGIIDARIDGQRIDIARAEGIETLLIRLDDRMIDGDRPVTIRFGDRVLHDGPVTRSIATLARTLADRGDPELLFLCEIAVAIPASR